jgi:hypothetical protein
MSRPRSGSVGEALRQEVRVGQHSLPGDNAFEANIVKLRERVLTAARVADPALAGLHTKWENTTLGTTFYVAKEATTATLDHLARAVDEEFAGAASVALVTIEVPGARFRSQREKIEAFAVHVLAKAVKVSLWHAAKAAAPYVLGGLFLLFLLYVIW